MAVKYSKTKAIEVENAVIDGMNISGHWSRMFEQRVIFEYTPELIEKITDLPEADSFAYCYQCAKCVPVCPVDTVGDYGPRKIYNLAQTGTDLTLSPNLWLCTTCSNCLRVCPKEVNMVKIMPAVREQAILSGSFVPKELQDAFENTVNSGNPLGQPQRKREAWIQEAGVSVPVMKDLTRPVEVLWYVGSYPSYHPRGINAASAAARIFSALGIDFAILGKEEKDDADSQRLAGEKGLFEMMAEYNIQTFNKYEWKEMVVTGPHELNAFKNLYPQYGFNRPVVHYTTFLARYLEQLKPLLKHEVNVNVTYHDPCYLGRHHGEYEAPRQLLQAIPGLELVEMDRSRQNGYCCGGGGGGMWMDSFRGNHIKMRLSDKRAMEAASTGANVLAVACPFEVSRFEDAVKSTGNEHISVLDILELLDRSMRGE